MSDMTTPVEQIKDRLNILDVVSSYIKLTPAGKSYKGKSPFTSEKTPSFFVSPDKGLYHCFSTGKGGDMFTFIQELEGVDFRGALKILADRAGVELVRLDPKVSEERDRLLDAMEDACVFFEKSLAEHTEAKQYLTDRGLEEKTIKEFRVGLAPVGWRNLYEVLAKKYSDKDILTAGLGKRTEKGMYDTFRDRIMFPIMDTAGRVIAFSGRILHPDEKSAKYVNSPDTPLFRKSDILFALDKAKHYIRKYNFTILAEGQFDVAMLHQAGFKNTVGVSGTALSDSLEGNQGVNNLGLVKRLSDNLILCFDADVAGIKAARRSADIALSFGMDVKVVSIPPEAGKDPADLIKGGGKDAFSALLRDAKHIIEFTAEKLRATSRNERDLGREITQTVLPDIARLPTETEKAYFIKRVSEITGLDQNALWKDLDSVRLPEVIAAPLSTAPKKELSKRQAIERTLMGLYFKSAEDPALKKELVAVVGEAGFATLEATLREKKSELVFATEVLDENEISYEVRREMLQNLEEDYLSEKLVDVRRRLRAAEHSGADGEAEQLAREYQSLAQRAGEIKNSRHLHKS